MRRDHSAKPSTAVIYARVSSDEQENEGFSIPAQQKLLTKYAAENGISVVEEYIDVETAKAAGRTGFNEMVEFFERQAKIKDDERRCRTILVEKTDRLYRNLKDYVTLDELRVDIHFVKENVVLSPDSHSSERFMHGIKVLMARQYVDNLSEEVKKGMLEKAEQGIWPSRAPIGYINVERADGKKVIIPDPECAEIITRMFENYAKGTLSLEDVGELAMAEGLPLKREGNFRAVVQYVLRNPIYTGDFQFKGKIYRGIHQPLVSRECWKKVQEKMAERRQRNTRKPKNRESFAFARLIACGHCGCSLVGERKKGKYVYYHCTYYRGRCEEPYVREEALEEKFTELLRGLRFDGEVLDWMRRALRESQADEQRYREEAVRRLQAEYNLLQRRIDVMYVDKLDGRIDARFFDQKQAEWREEQERLRDSIADHERANESYISEGVMLLELANRASELFAQQPASEKRRLLDFVLSNCTWKDGELTPVFRQPFDMIADMATACATKKVAGDLSGDLCQNELPVQGTSGSFRGKVLRLENRYYHTVYVDRVRMYVPGRSPEPQRKTKVRRSRLRIRADYAPIRNVIAIARQYEAYLKEPGIYTYRQAAQHFSTSKVTVGYHLALLTRLPADFVAWLEACTEDLPMAFFSLRRLRPVTMLSEPERKGALLELARTLVREMEGQPSEAVPELLWMLDEELHQMPRRLLRSIMLD